MFFRSSSSSLPVYLDAQNSNILKEIDLLSKQECHFDNFEAAVADFYLNLKILDPSMENPNPIKIH